MFKQKHHLPYHSAKKAKPLIIVTKKNQVPLRTLLLSTFHKTVKKNKSENSLLKVPPIHTSLHLSASRETSFLKPSQSDQLSKTQRQIKERISKFNEFNRRTFDEQSPIKQSLYFKNLKKCKSNTSKRNLESSIQSAITKKKIASKQASMRQSQLFWDNIRERIEQQQKQDSIIEMKRISAQQERLKKQFQKLIYIETPSPTIKKIGNSTLLKHKNSKKRFMTSVDDQLEVRPWNHTKGILFTPSGLKGDSLDSRQHIEEQF